MSQKGRTLPNETERFSDAATGATVWQVTRDPSINHAMYFLTPSLTPDNRAVIFCSYRTGEPNFYRADWADGGITQLTDASGIQGFSGVIQSDGRALYFTQRDAIRRLDLDSLAEETIAVFAGGKLGEVSLSADEQWLVSAARFADGCGLAVARVDGTSAEIIHRQDRVIIHPQFNPCDPMCIEFAADPAPRMYMIRRDGAELRLLYEHGNDEFVVHETWLGETGELVYTVWPYRVMRFDPRGGEHSLLVEFNAWHISPNRAGTQIVCDTVHPDIGLQIIDVARGRWWRLCEPGSSNSGSQWKTSRYALAADYAAAAKASQTSVEAQTNWTSLGADTIYGPQWTHPHPAWSRDGRYVTFTSDRSGSPQVYLVDAQTVSPPSLKPMK